MSTAQTGYINPRPKFTEAQQRRILNADGVPDARIWVEGHKGETLKEAVAAARDGILRCADGMRALAGGRREVDKAMDYIESKGAVVYDPVTKWRSDKDSRKMYAAMVSALNGEQRGLNPRKSRQGGNTRAAMIEADRLPDAQAEAIWKNKERFETNEVACKHMNDLQPPKLTELHSGWNPQIARRKFGMSGRDRGRRAEPKPVEKKAPRKVVTRKSVVKRKRK